MELVDWMLWLVLALAYALSAIVLQRLFVRFVEPFRQRARSPAQST